MANRAPRIDIPDDEALAPGEALLELPLPHDDAGRVRVRWSGGEIELAETRFGVLVTGVDRDGAHRIFAMRVPSNQIDLLTEQLRVSEGEDQTSYST